MAQCSKNSSFFFLSITFISHFLRQACLLQGGIHVLSVLCHVREWTPLFTLETALNEGQTGALLYLFCFPVLYVSMTWCLHCFKFPRPLINQKEKMSLQFSIICLWLSNNMDRFINSSYALYLAKSINTLNTHLWECVLGLWKVKK